MRGLLGVPFVIFSIVAGWYLTPGLLLSFSGNCESRSVYIINDGNRRSVTEALWLHNKAGENIVYSARINLFQDGALMATTAVERTVDLDSSAQADAIKIENRGAFILAGPKDSDPTFGPYIDPLTKAGFSARVYVFRTGLTLLTGFRDRPRWICQRRSG